MKVFNHRPINDTLLSLNPTSIADIEIFNFLFNKAKSDLLDIKAMKKRLAETDCTKSSIDEWTIRETERILSDLTVVKHIADTMILKKREAFYKLKLSIEKQLEILKTSII